MVKKQDSPRQLHVLREVKRKAQADQEARLQQTLLCISQQEARPSTSTQRTKGSTSTTPATLFTALGLSVKSKYINSLGQSISPSQLTVRLKFISQLDRLTTITDQQSQVLTPTRNLIPTHLPKRNRNKLPWHEITTLGTEFSLDFC